MFRVLSISILNSKTLTTQTLAAFIAEAGLPEDAGEAGKDDLSLEKVLEEKKMFDIGMKIEKLGTEEGDGGWSGNGK